MVIKQFQLRMGLTLICSVIQLYIHTVFKKVAGKVKKKDNFTYIRAKKRYPWE